MINEVYGNELYFAKLREDVKIPTKEVENGGYDIYIRDKKERYAALSNRAILWYNQNI